MDDSEVSQTKPLGSSQEAFPGPSLLKLRNSKSNFFFLHRPLNIEVHGIPAGQLGFSLMLSYSLTSPLRVRVQSKLEWNMIISGSV